MGGSKNLITVVEVGTANIKLIDAKLENNKIILEKFAVIPVTSTGSSSSVSFSSTIASMIKVELAKQNFTRRNGIILVPNTNVISREITIPVMPAKAVENTIKFEANQYIPVELASYRLDYKIIEEIKTDDGDKYRVYLVAVPSDEIDLYVNIMQKSNIDIKVVDISSNALSKLFLLEAQTRFGGNNNSEAYAVLDIGAGSAHMVIVANGTFQFEKKLTSFSGNILTEIISKYRGIDITEAEKDKITNFRTYIESDDDDDSASSSESNSDSKLEILQKEINKVLSSLINEISAVINYHYSKGASARLTKLFLTGGGANLEGLDALLTQSLNIDTEVLGNLKCIVNNSGKKLEPHIDYLTNVLGSVIRTDESEGKK